MEQAFNRAWGKKEEAEEKAKEEEEKLNAASEGDGKEERLPRVFSALWKELRSRGWKYAKGSGLVSWIWLKPGANAKTGKKGVDFFESEAEIMRYIHGDAGKYEEEAPTGRRAVKAPQRFEANTWDRDELSDHGSDIGEDGESGGGAGKRKRGSGSSSGKKKARGPKPPKRTRSAYAMFTRAALAELRASQPETPHAQLMALAAAKWKDMGIEERLPFTREALDDKKRYEEEFAAFAVEHPEAAAAITEKKAKAEAKAMAGAPARGFGGLFSAKMSLPVPLPSTPLSERDNVRLLEQRLVNEQPAAPAPPALAQQFALQPAHILMLVRELYNDSTEQLAQLAAEAEAEVKGEAKQGQEAEPSAHAKLESLLEHGLRAVDFSDHPLAYATADRTCHAAIAKDMAHARSTLEYLVRARGPGVLC